MAGAPSGSLRHLADQYACHCEYAGLRIYREHPHLYAAMLPRSAAFREQVNASDSVAGQRHAVARFFERLACEYERLPYPVDDAHETRLAKARPLGAAAWMGEALAA